MAKQEFTAQKAAAIAKQQMIDCDKIRLTRLNKIQEMVAAYYGEFKPSLQGRSNIPLPYFAKYIDELYVRLDDSPVLKFGHTKNSEILLAKKVQAAAEKDRSPSMGDWNRKDRMIKKMAVFSGLGIAEYYAQSAPDYESNLEPIAIEDFYFEATGGSDPEDWAFWGKGNIFRTRADIENGVEEGIYDKDLADALLSAGSTQEYKQDVSKYLSKYDKAKALGTDLSSAYVGDAIYPLAQWQMTHGGKRYFLLFDMISGKPLRFCPLKDVFKSDLYSVRIWQTHEDPHLVLSKSPADDFYPICEYLRQTANFAMDNNNKRLWGQKGFDPEFFDDPTQLIWQRPDQLIQMKSPDGRALSQGFVEFQTEDGTEATINLLNYVEGLTASVAGVSPQEPSNEDQKVGILFGNLQKVSARLGDKNKSYTEWWNKISDLYVHGLKEHISESRMVKVIGERGAEWEELSKGELTNKTEFDIEVVGSNVELEMSEARKKKQTDFLTSIANNPKLIQEVNPKFLIEEGLRSTQFGEEAIRRAMNKDTGSERVISHAAMAIEDILNGKEPELYRGADIEFVQYLYNYITETDLDDDQAIAIMNYGRRHLAPQKNGISIVIRNMALKASTQLSQQGIMPDKIQMPQQQPQNAPIKRKLPVRGVFNQKPTPVPINQNNPPLPAQASPAVGAGMAPAM